MLRRIFGSLLLVFFSIPAWGAVCSSIRSGRWSEPATWQACGGVTPGPSDSVVIGPGHQVLYDLNPPAGDTVYEIRVEAGATLRFEPGDYRVQIGRSDVFGFHVKGTLSVANGTTIAFDSSTDHPGFLLDNEAEFNSDGVSLGPLREATGFFPRGTTSACGGTEQWDIGTSSDIAGLVPGDLVQFATGAAQGRMYEVVGTAPGAIILCPELPDALSRGPRLTPHAPTSAVRVPGVVPVQLPATGDSFWAWHPWRVTKAGPRGWGVDERIAPRWENRGRFEWIGGDLSGFGDPVDGTGVLVVCGPGRPPVIIKHNDFHDYESGIGLGGGTSPDSGCDRPNLTWNVLHDGTVPECNYHLGILPTQKGPVTGGVIAWNTFYRTAHNTIQVNAAGQARPVVGFDIAYNTGFDLGASNSGECEFLETDVMSESVVQFNRAWDVSRGCGGIVAKPYGAEDIFTGNLYRGNFVQGAWLGIDISGYDVLYRGNSLVGNYVTDTMQYSIRSWAAYSNIVRRWAARDAGDPDWGTYGLSATVAEGNYLDGAGSALAHQGIALGDRGNSHIPTLVRNNVIRGLAGNSGFEACIYMVDSSEPRSADLLHNICDCGSLPACSGVWIRPWFLPTSPVVIRMVDNVVFGLQIDPGQPGAAARSSTPSANVTDLLANLTRWPLAAPSATGDWTGDIGEVARDPRFVQADHDFNYLPNSQEPGGGSDPPGSSIGVRAASFDASLFPPFLQAVMTVPVAIANDPIADLDQDSILDDLDKCPEDADPLQRDQDGDGVGDACDDCTDPDGDGFGSPGNPLAVCPEDNCPSSYNPLQLDSDGNGIGDECDLDDGLISVSLPGETTVAWQDDIRYDFFNLYRGDLRLLRELRRYTQEPGVDPGALRSCGLIGAELTDGDGPGPGSIFFYLVTGSHHGVEESLGADSSGNERPNQNPCP